MGKPVDREGPVQRSIIAYLRKTLPDAIVHHCKNEINRSGVQIARELRKAKLAGVLNGFPDIIVLPFSNVGAFFFEVKAEGGYASKTQKEMHQRLSVLGYHIAVVRSIDDVRECLIEWGIGFKEVLPPR